MKSDIGAFEGRELFGEEEPCLKNFVKASPIGIMTFDINGTVLHWNRAAQEITGWCEDEVLGLSIKALAEKIAKSREKEMRGLNIEACEEVKQKLERARDMVAVANEVLSLERENVRLSESLLKAGTVTVAKHIEAVTSLRKAEMVRLQASLEYCLARAELNRIRGRLSSSR